MSEKINDNYVDDDEIDIREVFGVLHRYKWSIMVITLLFLVGSVVFVYFKPNIYQSSATLKIPVSEKPASMLSGTEDLLSMALASTTIGTKEDEFALIKSRFLAEKALESLDINTRYFVIKHYKKIELYRKSPIVVSVEWMDKSLYGRPIKVIPVDKEHFRMVIHPSIKEKILKTLGVNLTNQATEPVDLDQTYRYGEKITTPWFALNVQKIFEPDNLPYLFTYTPNKKMYSFIQENIQTQSLSKMGSVISVAFLDNVPLRAKEIVDAILKAYNEEKIRLKTESANKTLQFIDRQLEAIHRTLQKSASKLEEYKATHVVMNVGSKAEVATTQMSDLETKLYEVNTQLSILSNLYNYIKNNKNLDGIDISAAQLVGPAITDLITKLQEAVTLRKSLLVDYTEMHPDVIKVTEQIQQLRQMLIATLKSTINGLKTRKQELEKELNRYKETLKSLPKEEQRLVQLTRDFMVNEKIYSYLLQKRAETAIIEASKVSDVQVLDPAIVPDKPVKPKRLLIVLVGLILGFIVGIALAFLRNFLDNTIKSAEDVEKLTQLPIYGVIPRFNPKKKEKPAAYYEAFRVIRTNLEFLADTGRSKLVTITSSVPKEGKTTVTTELGRIIAKSEKRTILLDLDMRRSKLHKYMQIPNKMGVSTLLAGKHGLDEAIQHIEEDHLDVITSGPTPPNPSELLMSEAFKRLITELLHRYDYVLLDSPPIGLVSDAMIAMRMSDLNLIVVRADYSKKEFFKNINKFVAEHELKAGIILNAVSTSMRSGAYGYGYGYDYGRNYNTNYYD